MQRYLFAAVAALALTASPASAQSRGASAGSSGELSVHGIFAYYWGDSGVGIGARYQLPIVPEGVLQARIKDDIAVDFGADFVHASFGRFPTAIVYDPVYGYRYTYADFSWNAIIPTVGVLWDFWLTPQFALYPKLEAGFAIGWWSGSWASGYGPSANTFFIEGIAGAKLKLKNNIALKAELGSGMLKLGVAFPM